MSLSRTPTGEGKFGPSSCLSSKITLDFFGLLWVVIDENISGKVSKIIRAKDYKYLGIREEDHGRGKES